jgi:hypothetical protein
MKSGKILKEDCDLRKKVRGKVYKRCNHPMCFDLHYIPDICDEDGGFLLSSWLTCYHRVRRVLFWFTFLLVGFFMIPQLLSMLG